MRRAIHGAGETQQEAARPASAGFAEAPQATYDVDPTQFGGARVMAVLDTAREAGLIERKTARISGRVSPALVAQAKRRTGLTADSDLIEFALANVALDDPFLEAFRKVRGTIDPDIDLGY